MKSWVKSSPRQASPSIRTFAAWVLGPLLALQGCTKEEPQTTTAAASKRASALTEKTARTADGAEYVPGQLLVRFKKNAGAMAAMAHSQVRAEVLHTYRTQPELQLVSVDESSLKEAIEAYQNDPNVEYVEPNYVVRINALPDDARFGELWGLDNTGQNGGVADIDLNAPEAWDLTTGSDTGGVVAVIDTGVDYTHPDLADNMWVNPGEIARNGVDDDGNGYVDDIHGINAITNTGDPLDDNAHGSHCAGSIAGRGNNGIGVAGVSWTAQIMGCKFLGSDGSGTFADAVKCLDYVRMMKTRTSNPVNVIATSNSYGGSGFSQAMLDAIIQHRDEGILLISAAGNSGSNNDSASSYPANYFVSNVISVAAHDRSNALASFSSYGRRNVHVAAPGVAVLSTIPGGYDTFDGTSMATPHVAGLVALLHAQDPSRDWRQLKNLVLTGGVASTGAEGKTLTGKRIRAADSGGQGSLTCDNQLLATRARPIANSVSASAFDPVPLIFYHVNCGVPAGPPTVTISPSGETLTLADTGQHGDEVAGDGMYYGIFEPTTTGSHTLTFPGGETLIVNAVQGYKSKTSPPIAWRTITGTNLSLGDDTVVPITSPFPIPYGGGAQETVYVSMNGLVSFTSPSLPYTNGTLPASEHQTLVAPFWDDLFPGPTSADNVYWEVVGTAPNRELVVEWRNVFHRSARSSTPPDTLLFQVVFFENSPDVLINYMDVLVGNATYDRGASATVGVQTSSTEALQHSSNTASVDDDTALQFSLGALSKPPVLDSVTVSPTTLTEGDTVNVDLSFSDPDGDTDGPWKVQVDSDWPGWFTEDFSQDAPSQGPVSASSVVRASGDVTVAVRVTDKNGVRSDVSKTTLAVADVPPALGAIAANATHPERQSLTFATSFTDPGLDSPWRVEWDFDYDGVTFTADTYTLTGQEGGVSLSYAFPNDGTFTVAARVVDKDGVVSNLRTHQIIITDLAPGLTGIAGNPDLTEGSMLELSASFTNPGDNSKPWRVQWDFDHDGTTFNVHEETEYLASGEITLSQLARDSGQLTYALRVVDADGSISQVQTVAMNIAEAHPILSPLNAQLVSGGGLEPSAMTFDLSASSGAEEPNADPIRGFLWDFNGDGTYDYASTSPFALFNYPDNAPGGGDFRARVRVLDEDSFSEVEVPVRIENVAPLLSAPTTVAIEEGSLLSLSLTATDPGADTLTFSVSGAPEGLGVTADGLVLWTPAFKHGSLGGKAHVISVTVTDDDSASTSQDLTLVVTWKDRDSDGMADTWEQANGLDPTVNDAAGDVNGDGVSNLTEFLSENGGPRIPAVPQASGPLSGEEVESAQLMLTATHVTDAGDLSSVRYQFQLFSDAALASTSQVCDVTVDQAATGDTTSATLPDATACPALVLEDDHLYSWRVRATDGSLHGAWSQVQNVRLNPVNDAPSAPRTSHPMSGTQVSTDLPLLVVDNALDVDDAVLTYVFELAEDAAFTQGLQSSLEVAGDSRGSTAWQVTTALKPFSTYYWRVTAKDPHGAMAQSEAASFTVYIGRPSNREPGLPGIVALDTSSTLTPTLEAAAATDADGDTLTYVFEVDSSPSFSSASRQVSPALQAEQDGKVRWQTAALTENMRYYWRARAIDPYSASDWAMSSFVINAQNDAPSAPVALNPSDAIIYSRMPTLIIQNATDPEGDTVTYSFEVRTADGTVATSGDDVPAGASGSTAFKVGKELEEGVEYIWLARAKDAAGAVSAASAEARFQVYKAPSVPEPPQEPDGGCSAGAGSLGGLLPLLAMALGLLGRRRRG